MTTTMASNFDDDSIDIELIENYHRGLLQGIDLENFIRREQGDKEFALKVKAYSEIFEGIDYYGKQAEFAETIQGWEREIKEESKKKIFEGAPRTEFENNEGIIPINRNNILWLGSAAAAAVLILIVFLTYFQRDKPEALADAYISQNLTTLSTTMGSATDNLAAGIEAFNEEDFSRAETHFRSLADNADLAPETTKYLGITYLRTEQYDKAIEQFNKLISYTDLYANPGKFYLAIALMKRSNEGDEEEAKRLLQEVVAQKLPGYKEATDWLTDL